MSRAGVFSSSRTAILTAIAMLALSRTATAGSDETIKFRIPQIPKFSHESKMGPLHRSLLVLEGSSAENWSEAIEVLQADRKGAYKQPREISTALRASRRESCDVVRDSVMAADDSSVLWSMVSESCGEFPAQYSLTRVLCGKKITFILIYTSYAPDLSPERKDQMASTLRSASVVKN